MRVVETGRNPTMRYIGRTHGVSIAWLHERFKDKHHLMTYCESSKLESFTPSRSLTLPNGKVSVT